MKRYRVLNLLMLLMIFFIFPKNVNAITFSANKSGDNLKPGGDLKVTINADVESNAQLSSFGLIFTYDSSVLNYVNGAGNSGVEVSGTNGRIEIKSASNVYNQNFTAATLNFKVNNNARVGSSNLGLALVAGSVKKNTSVTCNANGSRVNIVQLGSDPTLKVLKIPNSTLSPSFDKNVTDYSAQVKDVTEVDIKAEATDASSKISISNNYKNLQKGNNLIKILVTAENGASKTYNINVVLTKTPTDAEILKADATLKKLKVKGQKLEFLPEEKKYFLEVKYKIKKLTITAEPTNKNSVVKIDNPKLKIGKNTITIKVTSEDKSKTETYQIIVTRKDQKKEAVKTCPDVTSAKEWIIFSVGLILSFTIGILLGYLVCKKDILKKVFKKRKKQKEKKKEESKKEEALSDTIELDSTKILEKAKKK